jgi:hypothetical protein
MLAIFNPQLGTIGQWVSGAVAGLALVLALVGLARERRYRHSEQVRLVSAWISGTTWVNPTLPGSIRNEDDGLPRDPGFYVYVSYVNKSQLPIPDWALLLKGSTTTREGVKKTFTVAHHLRLVKPTGTEKIDYVRVDDADPERIVVALTSVMRDQGGKQWTRLKDGTLTTRWWGWRAKRVRKLLVT